MANEGSGWAVAYRVKGTQEGEFHDDAQDVDEATARKVFGRCIRAAELGLKVEGEEIDAVRLLKRGTAARLDTGTTTGWHTLLQHDVGAVERWKGWRDEKGETSPYLDDSFHPGVPCLPGAWGGDGCAMHAGYDLDENGLCVEGRRAVKMLDLIVIPAKSSMRTVWGFPATMTREELDEVHAFAVAELVHRGKDEGITDEQLARAVQVLERGSEVAR
jgi:hypothetical protein